MMFSSIGSESRTAAVFTLGCRLNRADSDLLADALRRSGFRVVSWGEAADLLVVNGCVVTAEAARKTRQAVRSARRRWPDATVALVGCAAEPGAEERLADLPVDLVLPNSLKTRLPAYLPPTLGGGGQRPSRTRDPRALWSVQPRFRRDAPAPT